MSLETRALFHDLAARGARFPIGTDLVLSEREHPGQVKLDGTALGQVMVESARRWNTPLAIPLMDLAVEKEWLGCAMGVPADRLHTWHMEGPVPRAMPPAPPTARLLANAAAIRHVARHSDLVACGMCIGPFSLMTKLVADPITPVYTAGLGERDEEVENLEQLLALCTDLVLRSVDLQIEAGIKAVMVCEPAANTVYFSPKQLEAGSDIFDRCVMDHNRRIAAHLAERGVALIFHDCGELTPSLIEKLATLNPAVLSLGSSRLLWEDAR
ncbi:MAG: uroporphyrinogen decarboxylase family protein, partial [Kiritimatiellia bacterium]